MAKMTVIGDILKKYNTKVGDVYHALPGGQCREDYHNAINDYKKAHAKAMKMIHNAEDSIDEASFMSKSDQFHKAFESVVDRAVGSRFDNLNRFSFFNPTDSLVSKLHSEASKLLGSITDQANTQESEKNTGPKT